MTTASPFLLARRLREHALSLPVAAYHQSHDATFAKFISDLFGVRATEQPIIACGPGGAQHKGRTAVFRLPEDVGAGVAVLAYNESHHAGWDTARDVGSRVGVVTRLLTSDSAWSASSRTDLALHLIDQVIEGNDPEAPNVVAGRVSLNWADPVWALAHVTSMLTAAEAAIVELQSSHHPEECLTMVAARVRAAEMLKENLPHAAEAVPVLGVALRESTGKKVRSAQVESLELTQWLLQTPRSEWSAVAKRLVAGEPVTI